MPGERPRTAVCHRRRAGGRPAPVRRGRPDSRPADTGLGARLEMGQTPAGHRGALGSHPTGVREHRAVCFLAQCLVARPVGRGTGGRTPRPAARDDAVREQRLSLVRQEGQKLFDSARVAVAASDWSNARLDLEKALTTLGGEAPFEKLREPAQALLKKVEQELRVEADRRASAGPSPAVRRQTRRSPVPRYAVHRHGSGRQPGSRAHRQSTRRWPSMASSIEMMLAPASMPT